MATLTEGRHTAEFLVSEANGDRSRATVTIAKGAAYDAGTVLGTVTTTGNYKPLSTSASDGSENASAVLYANVDASDAAVDAVVIARDAEVALDALVFPSGISAANKTTAVGALTDAGIITR